MTVVGWRDEAAGGDLGARGARQGRGEGGVGKSGQGAGDLVQIPGTPKVGDGRQEMKLCLEPPETRTSDLWRGGGQDAGGVQDPAETGLGLRIEEPGDAGWIPANRTRS